MRTPVHPVVGLYPTRAAAASARGRLLWRDIAPEQMRILPPGAGPAAFEAQDRGAAAHPEMWRDGLVAALLGALLAGFAMLALMSWGAVPPGVGAWPATLSVMGLGALLGLSLGAFAGRAGAPRPPPEPIDQALRSGQFVLVVSPVGDQQASLVRELLGPADAGVPARGA